MSQAPGKTGRRVGTTRAENALKFAEFRIHLSAMLGRDEIMKTMGISRSTYYVWLARSEKEDAEFAMSIVKSSYPRYYRRTIEGFEDQIKVLKDIRGKAKNPMVKIAATNLIGEFYSAIMQTVHRGPGVLNIVEDQKRRSEVEKLKEEASKP